MTQFWRAMPLAATLALAACATAPPAPSTSSAYADALVARYANLSQDHEAASQRYSNALRRNPDDDALMSGAIAASLAAGDEVRARQIVRQAPRENAPALVHIVRAVDALNAGRAGEADAQLTLADGTAAQELLSHIMLAWTRVGSGRVDEVLVDLRQLSRIRPYGALFAYQQGMVLDLAGRNEEALVAYGMASDGELWLAPAVERHADLLARMGRRDEAIALLRAQAERANPALEAALARLEAGGAAASSRLTASRGAAAAVLGLATLFQQENDRGNALTTLTVALMLDPDLDVARITRARAQAASGNVALARADLAHVAQGSPYKVNAQLVEAWILVDAGQEAEGLAVAQTATASGSLSARRTLADMYRRAARYAEAEAIYSALIADHPQDWRLHYARGVARSYLDHWPEAESDLRRAMEISPEQPEVLNFLGYSYLERGERMTEALAMVTRAAALRPRSGVILDSLAWGYYLTGDYERALDAMERALEFEPGHPVINDHLGDIYWRLGRRVEARFQWRRALTLEPDDAAAIEAKIESGLPDLPPTRSATR